MKILMQTTYYYPHVSGLTLFLQRLAEELAKRRHQVTVITSRYKKDLLQREQVGGVNIVRTPVAFHYNKGVFLPRILLDTWPHIKRAEVVHFNLPSVEAMDLAIATKLLKKPVVTTYVCDLSLRGFLGSRLLSRLIDLNHFVTLQLSDQIASFTLDFARHSRLLKFFANRVTGIYPPVELTTTAEKNNFSAPTLHSLPSTFPLLGMATRLAADKGIEYLLNALPILTHEFANLKILIAGDMHPVGETAYHKKLTPLLKKYKDRLTFLGQLTSSQLVKFYRSIDLLIVSSINSTEAFGMVQVEAMLQGTPVVTTDLPGVRVPVQKTGMGEIARVADSQDLAGKITRVLKNKKAYIRPKARIRADFSLEQTVNQYLALYKKAQQMLD